MVALAQLIDLDLTAHVPIYTQIGEQLRARIEAGELQDGEQLPTVRQLADDLQVNFNTVARAYRMLDEQGWISTQHGRGTFVLDAAQRRGKSRGAAPDQASDGSQPATAAGQRGDPDRAARPTLRQLVRGFADQAQRYGFSPEQVAREVGYVLEQWAQEEE